MLNTRSIRFTGSIRNATRTATEFCCCVAETRIAYWLNTAVHIYVALIFWTAREGLTQMMLGTDPDRSRFDIWVASAYPLFAMSVAAITWAVVQVLSGQGYIELLLTTPHYTTMFWLLLAPAFNGIMK